MQELSSPPSDQSIEAAVQTIDATLARLRAQPEEPSADMQQTVLQTQLKMMQEPVRSQGNFAAQQNIQQEPAGSEAAGREAPPQVEETPPRRSRMETASHAVDEAMRRSRRRTVMRQEDESAQEPAGREAAGREAPPPQSEETPPRRSRMETASHAVDEAMRRSRRRTMYTENAETPLRQRPSSTLQPRPHPGTAHRSDTLEQPADDRAQP